MQIEMTPQRWGLLGALIIALILLVFFSWPKTPKVPDTTAALNAALETAKKPLLAEIKAKDGLIEEYKARIVVSEGKYSTLAAKYVKLQKEKTDVKPPTTNAELRSRFTALGYPPLPGK
jgi:hypothetical protein